MSTIPTVNAVIADTPYTVTLNDGRGHRWLGDEPAELQGADAGPDPHHLLLSSLGACTAITLKMYAARKGWPLTGTEVTLQFNPEGSPPAGLNHIQRRITLHGELSAEQRERLLQIANACPIHKVLSGEIRIASVLDPGA